MKVSNTRVEKRAELAELRSRKVAVLLQIIEELDLMDLSIQEIETILRICGLNADSAMRFGREMRDLKAGGHFHSDNIALPYKCRD